MCIYNKNLVMKQKAFIKTEQERKTVKLNNDESTGSTFMKRHVVKQYTILAKMNTVNILHIACERSHSLLLYAQSTT